MATYIRPVVLGLGLMATFAAFLIVEPTRNVGLVFMVVAAIIALAWLVGDAVDALWTDYKRRRDGWSGRWFK